MPVAPRTERGLPQKLRPSAASGADLAGRRAIELEEDRAGDWLVRGHFPNHIEGGMMTR